MFSRSRLSTRGEEEQLLGRTSHELTNRSVVTPTPTSPSHGPTSPQPTSPLSVSMHHPHYHGSYETLGRRQTILDNEKKVPAVTIEKPKDNAPVLGGPFNLGDAVDARPTTINDPFTGQPKAVLSPDHGVTPAPNWSMFEGCTADSELQDKFWSHVAKIRELQSEVAKMHIAMESIGQLPEPQPPKEKGKDKTKDSRKLRGQTANSARVGTTTTAVNTDQETGHSASDTDHAGSGRENRPTKKLASTESPIATDNGEHFAQRKEAIHNIVKKLTALSQQVTDFHQIPTPEITFPVSPTRPPQSQPPLQAPPQLATLTVPSPNPAHVHQTPARSKAGQVQRHSPLGPHGQPVPRISIPPSEMPVSGIHTQPSTPSKAKAHSVISGDGTLHESPVSLQ